MYQSHLCSDLDEGYKTSDTTASLEGDHPFVATPHKINPLTGFDQNCVGNLYQNDIDTDNLVNATPSHASFDVDLNNDKDDVGDCHVTDSNADNNNNADEDGM